MNATCPNLPRIAFAPTVLVVCAIVVAGLSACSSHQPPPSDVATTYATPGGYWEGKGKANEIPMKDDFRTLTRSADYDFWFTVGDDGNAVGEVEILYDSELKVQNLPQVTVPLPTASMTFAPSVGGKVTDLNPRRKFPLVGVLANHQLTLEIATPESARPPIEFTIRADPGVSAGFNVQRAGPGSVKGNSESQVIKIPMMPFSPFNGSAKVEKRPAGPFAATYDETGKNYSINWSARQMGGEQRKAELTPEMQQALQKLRQQLKR
jgi:hypothetical protein